MAKSPLADSRKSKKGSEATFLDDIGAAFGTMGDREDLTEALLLSFRERFGGDHGMLLDFEESTGGLRTAATFGLVEEMLAQDMRIFAQHAAIHPDEDDSFVIAPVAKEVQKLAARKSVRRDMTKEVLIFPLTRRDKAVGVIYLGSKGDTPLFMTGLTKKKLKPYGTLVGELLNVGESLERLVHHNKSLQEKLLDTLTYDSLLGQSEAMRRVVRAIELIAPTDIPVTLIGEKGTGKELVASVIHRQGPRKKAPFSTIIARELSEELLPAFIFGDDAGKKPGNRIIKGALREAKGGTLYIENVNYLSAESQDKLVDAMETGSSIAENGSRTYITTARIIFSLGKNPKELFENGELQEKLYRKISLFPIMIYPLRSRLEDLAVLVSHFVEEAASEYGKRIEGIDNDIYDFLGSWQWEENLDELQREMRLAVLRIPDNRGDLTVDALSGKIVGNRRPVASDPHEGTLKQRLAIFEKRMIIESLEKNGHNQSTTANELGLSRQALINKLQRYGIETGRKYKRKMKELAELAGE